MAAAQKFVARMSLAPALFCFPLMLVLLALLFWPIALIVKESLQAAAGNGLTIDRYLSLVLVPRHRQALIFSMALSGAVATLSTLLCLAPAWLLVRREFPGKRLVRAVLALPMSFAGVIVGFLMVILLGRSGFVAESTHALFGQAWLSGAAYGFAGLLTGYLYFEIPRATLTLESALRKFDVALEQAARSLGAKPWQLFFWVILPAIWPALLSTFAVTFSVSLGSFGVVLILSTRRINLLPLEIFTQYLGISSDRGLAAAMSIVLMAIALAANCGVRAASERARWP